MYLMCIPENIHPPRRQRKFREVCVGKGGGGYDKLSCDWWGSKTKVPLGLDSFWNYTKVIIKDYGLHFDLID